MGNRRNIIEITYICNDHNYISSEIHQLNMRTLSITILSLLATSVLAQQRGMDAAIEIARQHFGELAEKQQASGNGSHSAPRRNDFKPQLAYTAKADKQDAFYVFNNPEGDQGFVIVGADETTRQIIGYTEHGSFDADNMPENVRWWLSQYTEQFEQSKKAKADAAPQKSPYWGYGSGDVVTISPLLHAQWGQYRPFNNLIPKPEGYYSNFPTGCVATAMAQVMHYYRYPDKGTGSKSYTRYYDGEPVTFEADFESTEYDWTHMLCDYFDGYYSEEQANAVATLMYHAGVACNMWYEMNGSGSFSSSCLSALVRNFGYDKSAWLAIRDNYSDYDWEELIYNELKAHRPVLYFGRDKDAGGHAFIIHGYDSTWGYYDINWGWSSGYDGKYLLNMMNPNFYDFSLNHEAIINLMPDTGIEPQSPHIDCSWFKVTINNKEFKDYSVSKDVSIIVSPSFDNNSAFDCSVELGMALQSADTHELSCIQSFGIENLSSGTHITFSQKSIYTSNIKINGSYDIVPLWRAVGEETWQVLKLNGKKTYSRIHVVNKTDPIKYNPTFTLATTTIGINQSVAIESPNYYGTYYVITSDKSIVDTDYYTHEIIGRQPGTATITVKTDVSLHCNAVEQQFEITVTDEYVPVMNIGLDLRADKIPLGWSIGVDYDYSYNGSITVTCQPEGIVSFDHYEYGGSLRGEQPGTAQVTFHIEGDNYFKAEDKTYTITVSDRYPDNIRLRNFRIPNDGYICLATDRLKFSYTAEKYYYTEEPSRIYYELSGLGPTTMTSDVITPDFYIPHTKEVDWYLGNFAYATDNDTYLLRFLASDKTTFIPFDGDEYIYLTNRPLLIIPYFTDQLWSTICLPYEADMPDNTIAYRVETATDGTLDLIEVRDDHLEMGQPYILHNDRSYFSEYFWGPDIPEYHLYPYSGMLEGTYAEQRELIQGDYIIKEVDGEWGFAKVTPSEIGDRIEPYTAVIHIDPDSEEFAQNDFLRLNFVPRGDANSDGVINVSDIIAIQRIQEGVIYDQYNTNNADANRDNTVDEFDIYRLRREILGY